MMMNDKNAKQNPMVFYLWVLLYMLCARCYGAAAGGYGDNVPDRASEKSAGAQEQPCRLISERHRHRYEFNNEYRKILTDAGLVLSGTSPDERLVETVELTGRPFHVGVQFHPEFKSRPNRPHPLFMGFIEAALFKGGKQS